MPKSNINRIFANHSNKKVNNFENDVFFKAYNPPLRLENYSVQCNIKKLKSKSLESMKKSDFGPLFKFIALAHKVEFHNFDDIVEAVKKIRTNLECNGSSHFPIWDCILKLISN